MKYTSVRAAEQKHRKRNTEILKQIQQDLERYGSEILSSEEMEQAFRQTHHTRSTVGEHTQRVAKKSLTICYALDRLHIRTDIPAVVTGALCHDLGILGRDEKYASQQECSRQHPTDSIEVARKLVNNLPAKVPGIIQHHMWPTAGSKVPNTLEGMVVCVADKAAAVEDFIRGSSIKPCDFRTTMRTIAERNRGYLRKKKKQ